jgi:YbbR domain-containing protein
MFDVVLSFVRRLLEDPHYKLLAVVLALGVWLYVQSGETEDVAESIGLKVELPDGMVATKPLPHTVSVTFSGPRSALRRVDFKALKLPVDMREQVTDVGAYTIEFSSHQVIGLPKTVKAINVSPSTHQFSVDREVVRKVSVVPRVVGEPRDGWMVVSTRIEPGVVEVRGPARALENVGSVQTLNIDVSDLPHDSRLDATLDLPSGVHVVESVELKALVDIEPMLEVRTFASVPVIVRGRPGYVVVPDVVRVTLKGPAASLRQIRERDVVAQVLLDEGASEARQTVDFQNTDGSHAEILLPSEQVKVVRVTPEQVEVVRR